MPQIQFVDQERGGFLDNVEIPEGQTVSEFLAGRMPGANLDEFTVQVDRDEVPEDHVLTPGQRVTVAPIKVAGATRWFLIV